MATAARSLGHAQAVRAEVDAYFEALQQKSLLRFITCGSVDDGKSTLVGRLLYDAHLLLEDQLAALERESAKAGSGEGLDFALLVDGLAAEREQGITIDVAYRFFATEKRKFIIADTPGHEQYTRNMATGASTADLAIILIDARKGVLPQTRRHSFLTHLLGIRQIVLAVNKMDLVDYEQARFDEIVADYRALADEIGIADFTAIPVAAAPGDNITRRSPAMPWYAGPALLEHLETVPLSASVAGIAPFRMAVQWVNRPNQDFRGFAGTIASGRVRVGDSVAILPSGRATRIGRIVTADGDLDEAMAGQAVTLTFADELDCSRGDLVAAAGAATVAETLAASLIWMAEAPLAPNRAYWLKAGTQSVSAKVTVDEVVAMDGEGYRAGAGLALNDIGQVRISLDRKLAATTYADNRRLGGFILVDKASNATVAAGMIAGFPGTHLAGAHLERIFWIPDEEEAKALRSRFAALGRSAFILTEAALREGLCSDLAPDDLAELARRAGEGARLLSAAGVTVIVALAGVPGMAIPGTLVGAGGEAAAGEDWVII